MNLIFFEYNIILTLLIKLYLANYHFNFKNIYSLNSDFLYMVVDHNLKSQKCDFNKKDLHRYCVLISKEGNMLTLKGICTIQ